MRGDRQQIQTSVLGGADSKEPLMLPLEAIELDPFSRHQRDTFWCGLALLTAYAKQQQGAAAARRATQECERAAKGAGRARKLLETLERRGAHRRRGPLRELVKELVNEA
ncbi:hypothetical protein AV521_45295 [Streptomyces sp. IMTB 2501]|uniref:hypothetical protein n=1 Tax=Streptomyces sp. IMTB 2501 TaxID=1776340 RepID=UPI00096DF541|nr:hypothetical protein [Streptomyces sp. IMTB 2501]OLZ59446.1 hypothetical protein AV521_45295 [Streptomyces sp. IMTB 2501]